MRAPMMSGHCATPSVDEHGYSSHQRCHDQGGGNRANPRKEFSPCPDPCHFPEERYECGNCGGILAEAPLWPNEDPDDVDENGNPNPVYTHIDPKTGRATGQECPDTRVSRNPEPEPEPEVEDICPDCLARRDSPVHYSVCGDDAFEEDEDDFADLLDDD